MSIILVLRSMVFPPWLSEELRGSEPNLGNNHARACSSGTSSSSSCSSGSSSSSGISSISSSSSTLWQEQ